MQTFTDITKMEYFLRDYLGDDDVEYVIPYIEEPQEAVCDMIDALFNAAHYQAKRTLLLEKVSRDAVLHALGR